MNNDELNAFISRLGGGYKSQINPETGELEVYGGPGQDDSNRIRDISGLEKAFSTFSQKDEQGRPLYGTEAYNPENSAYGGMFTGQDGRQYFRAGTGDTTNQYFTSAGGKPEDLIYDPKYGYGMEKGIADKISGFQNSEPLWLSMLPQLAMAAMSGAVGYGAMGAEAGVNAGGLDGMLGDSIANYSAGMGANNAFTTAGGMSAAELGIGNGSNFWNNDMFQNVNGTFDDVNEFVNNSYNTQGVDFAGQNSTPNYFGGPDGMQNFTNTSGNIGSEFGGNWATNNNFLTPTAGTTLPAGVSQWMQQMGFSAADIAKAGGSVGSSLMQGAGSQGSNGLFSNIGDFLKNPLIPGTNATGANTLGALLNYFMQQRQADQLGSAAQQAARLNNPMDQPQRAPFQQAYTSLMMDPNSYQRTPYAVGQQNLADQAFQANVSKYGPGGTQFTDYLKNFQNIQSQDFFKLADQLSTAGGFNQGAGGGGSAAAGLLGQQAQAGNNAFEGFGRLLSAPVQQSNSASNPFQNIFNALGNSTTTSL